MRAPDAAMLALADRLAQFMRTGDEKMLDSVFVSDDVTIIENFPPYVFNGSDAVVAWTSGFLEHAQGLSDLDHVFGVPQDFSCTEGRVFFTLPTVWTGRTQGRQFREEGGWSFVLSQQVEEWRVCGYGWSVTQFMLI